jgi:hypothetical protein
MTRREKVGTVSGFTLGCALEYGFGAPSSDYLEIFISGCFLVIFGALGYALVLAECGPHKDRR